MLINIGIANAILVLLVAPSIAFFVFRTLKYLLLKYNYLSRHEMIFEFRWHISFAVSILITFIVYLNLTTVYVIRDKTYNTYNVLGSLKYKFKNDTEVNIKIKNNYTVINDSERRVTVESVVYSTSSYIYNAPERYYNVIYSYEYSSAPREINYLFTNPPESQTSSSSGTKIDYWLHY
jgi:hypothetical protein